MIHPAGHADPKSPQFVPIPLLCTVTFGAPLNVRDGEDKDAFLDRARTALLDLAPDREGSR